VPNPAQTPNSSQSLNDALMARCCRTIRDSPCLKHIVEGQSARDSLSLDPHRTRRKHGHLAVAEAGASAAVVDFDEVARVPEGPCTATIRSMLEPGHHRCVRHALPDRASRLRAADLPKPALDLVKRRRRLGRAERNCGGTCRRKQKESASHARPFTTSRLTAGTAKNQASSPGSIAKVDEQKAQSTRIIPSSPTIASRSSTGKRAMTERT